MVTFSNIKVGDYVYIFSSDGIITKQRVSDIEVYNGMAYTQYMLEADPNAGCLRASIIVPSTMMACQTRELVTDHADERLVACASADALREVVKGELEDIEFLKGYFTGYLKNL